MRDVPLEVLVSLAAGAGETVNLMEWLATDMSALARNVAAGSATKNIKLALLKAADQMDGRGVTERIRIMGSALADALPVMAGPFFEYFASHQSDIVRQWACYAVNDSSVRLDLTARLTGTVRFAADSNMSVREAAWMAFRPNLTGNLDSGLALLEPLTRRSDANIRRFAIEVSRPRSVWGAHIPQLKRRPELAYSLLENTRADRSRYVRLAVGNWLNDASKTRPDWVSDICTRWIVGGNLHTDVIVRRGLRSIMKAKSKDKAIQCLI
jgi:3-methyladenine DNA glycosylase AlkC